MNRRKGDIYDGEFLNDKKHGRGVYIKNNGKKYIGSWKYGKKDGYGIFVNKTGSIQFEYWQNDFDDVDEQTNIPICCSL